LIVEWLVKSKRRENFSPFFVSGVLAAKVRNFVLFNHGVHSYTGFID
jgi:hypothetical protein